MKRVLTLGSLLLALSAAPFASAVPILGEIHVVAFGGTAVVDTTANTVTFAPAAPANNAAVSHATGAWSGLVGTSVSYANFTYSPLAVSTPGGWAAGTIWRIDANSYFVLDSIYSISEGVGLVLQGTGTAHHDGFEATTGAWSFSADASGNAFSFSSTVVNAPDGGTTAALLGIAFIAFAAVRRKLTA